VVNVWVSHKLLLLQQPAATTTTTATTTTYCFCLFSPYHPTCGGSSHECLFFGPEGTHPPPKPPRNGVTEDRPADAGRVGSNAMIPRRLGYRCGGDHSSHTPHGSGPNKTRRADDSRSSYDAKLLITTTSATERPPAAQENDPLVAASGVTDLTLTRARRSTNTHKQHQCPVTSLRQHQDNDAIGSQTKRQTEFASVASGASRGGFGGGWVPSGPKNRHAQPDGSQEEEKAEECRGRAQPQ
jgi:hypothetical protein